MSTKTNKLLLNKYLHTSLRIEVNIEVNEIPTVFICSYT
jgi:hypothetical protein